MRRSFRSGDTETTARIPPRSVCQHTIHGRPLVHCSLWRAPSVPAALFVGATRGGRPFVPWYPRTLNSVVNAISDLEAIWNNMHQKCQGNFWSGALHWTGVSIEYV